MQLNHKGRDYCLREMRLTDLPELLPIEEASHSHPWSEANFRSSITSSHHCWVLLDGSNMLAYIITSTAADEAELLNITVDPAHRRCGFATLLLEGACDNFDSTIETLFLEVRESNLQAIALYDQLGFNAIGQRQNYYPSANGKGREHATIMAKTLSRVENSSNG